METPRTISLEDLSQSIAAIRQQDGADFGARVDAIDKARIALLFFLDDLQQQQQQQVHDMHRLQMFHKASQELVLLCNSTAMQQLDSSRADHLDTCKRLLELAVHFTRKHRLGRPVATSSRAASPSRSSSSSSSRAQGASDSIETKRLELRALCFNNIACFYRTLGKPYVAIQFLERVLKLQKNCRIADAASTASTHLNLCAVLSQMKRHEPAVEHAKAAIELLLLDQEQAKQASMLELLLVAHFNLAVEYEHLKQPLVVVQIAQQALTISKAQQIPGDHELVLRLEQLIQDHS